MLLEAADFVHIIDTFDYSRKQVLEFFSEVAGVAFSPETPDAVFVAASDPSYGSLLEYSRRTLIF